MSKGNDMFDHWNHDGFGPPHPHAWFVGPLSLLAFAGLVALVVWAVLRLTRVGRPAPTGAIGSEPSAETLVRERFARGDIDEATFRQQMATLAQFPPRQA
jgi:putative membrane protein